MVPYGKVIGTDRKGNFKVRPEQGGRNVILSRSAASNFRYDQMVEYNGITHGDNVDFASKYAVAGLDSKVAAESRVTRTIPPLQRPIRYRDNRDMRYEEKKPASRESIERTLAKANITGVYALVIYDPSQSSSEDNFISIARNRIDSGKAIDYIFELVEPSGGGCSGPNSYEGSNGLFGQRYHVVKDFRPMVRDKPKQGGILFIPLEGLLSGSGYSLRISHETLKNCVESAHLPTQ